jgi:hypothetical protein
MNERMLEIAKQAGLKKDHGSDREYIGDFDWRLFGDLIVQECAGIANKAEPYQSSDLIRKHFGVEE